ncbi:response regulator [Dethiothermospora halolimnae]|uniref:response regulator n=1 Tax=Dethiothermospora halolimnae TaxID=3114390 RepID=UPI003CCBC456
MENRTVLFVDDEPSIIGSLRRGLLDEKYNKEFAYSGEEALKIMEEKDIDVIVTDMRMPEMNGLELLKIVAEKYPDVIKMVLSGYTQLPQILATINQVDIFKFITKPWNLDEELIPIIRKAIETYNMKLENEELKKKLEKKNQLYEKILKSTEDKFSQYKKDYKDIKNLNNYIFDYFKIMLGKENYEDKDEIIKDIKIIKSILGNFVDSTPTEEKEFNVKKLVKDLTEYISEENYTNKIEINLNGVTNFKCKGNYKLLVNMLKSSMSSYLNNNENNSLRISVMTKDLENTVEIYFIIELFNSMNQDNMKRIKTLVAIMTHVMENTMGYIKLQTEGDKNTLVLMGKFDSK